MNVYVPAKVSPVGATYVSSLRTALTVSVGYLSVEALKVNELFGLTISLSAGVVSLTGFPPTKTVKAVASCGTV